MPVWTNQIPSDNPYNGIALLRTPASGAIAATILSDNIVGTYTHYAHGRTQPCERPDCPLCSEKVPYRYHAYIAILSERTARQAVLEITAAPAAILLAWRVEYSTLRGAHLVARRSAKRANGKVIMEVSQGHIAPNALPKAIDCTAFMSTMWNLAETRIANKRNSRGFPEFNITPEQPEYVSDELPPAISEAVAEIIGLYDPGNGRPPSQPAA
jgi:hypothetical protein